MNPRSMLALVALTLFASNAMASVDAGGPTPTPTPAPKPVANTFSQVLYVFDPDLGATAPTCSGKCAEIWPPALVSAAEAAALVAPYASVPRANGLLQLTLDGRPLYTFYLDRTSADAKGDGLGGVWHIVLR